jgi:hypothetical protein
MGVTAQLPSNKAITNTNIDAEKAASARVRAAGGK